MYNRTVLIIETTEYSTLGTVHKRRQQFFGYRLRVTNGRTDVRTDGRTDVWTERRES